MAHTVYSDAQSVNNGVWTFLAGIQLKPHITMFDMCEYSAIHCIPNESKHSLDRGQLPGRELVEHDRQRC